MDWPNPQDYNETIQNPAICFSDPELQNAQIELSTIGLPRPITGAFASVYKVNGEKIWAVRCIHTDISDLSRRYSCILKTLDKLQADWSLKTQFLEEGIKVQGHWYPIVKMQWADGLPLDRYIARHGSNQTKINKLAKNFRKTLEEMRTVGIAHGDLQHGNILLAGDDLKLLDYDGFFVPELTGLKSAELGHANYQHPYRSREHFGSYIDNFPAWLISISLMSIAADPELLSYSKDRECLLFAHADLIAPYESELFTKLREHPKQEIRNAVHTLIRLLNCPVEVIPFLDASDDELLALPEMDPSERMRLLEENSDIGPLRFLERSPVLCALEKLSTTKRGTKDKLGFLLRQASSKGGAMLSSVLNQRLNSHDNAAKGDIAFAAGNIQDAIEAYVKALAQASEDEAAFKKKIPKSIAKRKVGSDTLEMFDYDKFTDHLNLRLGTSHLLNNNAASSVFHYKTVVQKYRDSASYVESLDAIVGLMMAYCQFGRERDAVSLMEETCSWKSSLLPTPKYSAHNLSCTLLGYGNGPLAGVTGLKLALKMVASYFQKEAQYEYAASLFEAARVQRDMGSASDLDLLLRIGHCHLLNKRADLALHCFNSIISVANAPPGMHDRAAVALAVAFKMMNSRQDVAKAMRSRLPENLYNCFKSELDGPLGNMEELSEVICAFAAELGEAELMGGLRLATRLAADSFKRLDDKKTIETIIEFLNDDNFTEADKMATEELLGQVDLRRRFAEKALAFARSLTTCGAYKDAFEILKKYNCPNDVVVDAMEGQIEGRIRRSTRQLKWDNDEFNYACFALEALCKEMEPSDELCKSLSDSICGSSDRSDEFLFDVRRLTDLIAAHTPDGSSNPHVLKMLAFALTAESPQDLPARIKMAESSSSLGKQFIKATKAASVPAAETIRMRDMESDVLQLLRESSQRNWDPKQFDKLRALVDEMKKQRSLSPAFCDKVAAILLDHFSQTGGLIRWQKDGSSTSDKQKEGMKTVLNSLMDTFSTVSGVDPGTLRKLQRCIERI